MIIIINDIIERVGRGLSLSTSNMCNFRDVPRSSCFGRHLFIQFVFIRLHFVGLSFILLFIGATLASYVLG